MWGVLVKSLGGGGVFVPKHDLAERASISFHKYGLPWNKAISKETREPHNIPPPFNIMSSCIPSEPRPGGPPPSVPYSNLGDATWQVRGPSGDIPHWPLACVASLDWSTFERAFDTVLSAAPLSLQRCPWAHLSAHPSHCPLESPKIENVTWSLSVRQAHSKIMAVCEWRHGGGSLGFYMGMGLREGKNNKHRRTKGWWSPLFVFLLYI